MGYLKPLPTPTRPWEWVSMDFILSLPEVDGYDSVWVVCDMLTKEAHFLKMASTIIAEELLDRFMHDIFRLHGMPAVVVSDRDSKFTSEVWQQFFQSLGTKLHLSTAYHPESDGQTERVNRTLQQILRCYAMECPTDWVKYLDLAEFVYNRQESQSTKMSPFYATRGYNPLTPLHLATGTHIRHESAKQRVARIQDIQKLVQRNLLEAKDRYRRVADRRRRPVEIKVGDQVKLSTEHIKLIDQPCHKLKDRWLGPFTVIRQIDKTAFELDLNWQCQKSTLSFMCPNWNHGIWTQSLVSTDSRLDQFAELGTISREMIYLK
jgi:hypothetical protein